MDMGAESDAGVEEGGFVGGEGRKVMLGGAKAGDMEPGRAWW